jgi:hypothetical protein
MDGEVENSIRAKLTFELGNSQTPEVHATPPGVQATVIEAANRVAVTSDGTTAVKVSVQTTSVIVCS